MAKYRHLTLTERIEIYSLLKENKSLRKIAKALKRDPTTIAKEIKNIWKQKRQAVEEDLLTNARTRTVVIRQACAERNGVLTSVTNVRGVLNIAKITKNRCAKG